jgi:hypothetical protein
MGPVVISGDAASPSSVVVNNALSPCFEAHNGAQFTLENLTMEGFAGILVFGSGAIVVFSNVIFGACATFHIQGIGGGYIGAQGSYEITGGAESHCELSLGSILVVNADGITVTVSGMPAFSSAFLVCNGSQASAFGFVFAGSATGQRYLVFNNGVITTNGSGASFFPGSTAGAISSGGQYS